MLIGITPKGLIVKRVGINLKCKKMAIDSTPSQVATSALQAIPFGSIIGAPLKACIAPLKACIEAQAMAAQTSWQFIQEVGLNTDPETGALWIALPSTKLWEG